MSPTQLWARGLLMLCGAAASAAQAAENPADLQRRALAATCANCHGTQGRGIPQGELPPLAGASAAYIAEQLHAFRSGTRPATVMHQIAKGYTPAQIDTLAAYFAAQAR